MFGTLGLLVCYLMRQKKISEAKRAVCDELDKDSVICPGEIKELREVNNVEPQVYRAFVSKARGAFPSGRATFGAFEALLTATVGPTVPSKQLRCLHHMERVAFASGGKATERDLRYLELLYLHVVKGEIADRLDVLLEMFASPDPPPADAPASRVISEENLAQLIEGLANTSQLQTRARVKDISSFPTIAFAVKSPREHVTEAVTNLKLSPIGGLAFKDARDILTSDSVCVWGECFAARPL